MQVDLGHKGGLINPPPWCGSCRDGCSNTGGPPLPQKRVSCQKKILINSPSPLQLEHFSSKDILWDSMTFFMLCLSGWLFALYWCNTCFGYVCSLASCLVSIALLYHQLLRLTFWLRKYSNKFGGNTYYWCHFLYHNPARARNNLLLHSQQLGLRLGKVCV